MEVIVGAIAAWYFLVGRKDAGREARDERALEYMRTAAPATPVLPTTPTPPVQPSASSSAPVATPSVPVQVKALEVIAAAPPPPTTLLPAAEAKQNQPAPRVLPVAPDATVRTAVPKAFVRQTFQASGSLLEAKNADGTRPPIFPHYLQSHRR